VIQHYRTPALEVKKVVRHALSPPPTKSAFRKPIGQHAILHLRGKRSSTIIPPKTTSIARVFYSSGKSG
jgi:hypothetical protein